MKNIHGWGRYPIAIAKIALPTNKKEILANLNKTLIPRGQGRSYGDSANADIVLQTDLINRIGELDEKEKTITVDAGVLIRDLLALIVPRGWFLPVTPGTSWVTIGGAIASDVHGKNHHQAGTFGDHTESLQIMLGSGEIVRTSRTELSDLFHATCGGMGLTGIILSAKIRLKQIKTPEIIEQKTKTHTLEEACNLLSSDSEYPYNATWVDLINQGSNHGRSILISGKHTDNDWAKPLEKKEINIPCLAPSFLLNSHTGAAFNHIYFLKTRNIDKRTVSLGNFFYPLDRVRNWNRLYGRAGFIQYQFLLPDNDFLRNVKKIQDLIKNSESKPLLAVLKNLGTANKNLMSFPAEGHTLALDFKINESTITLTNKLNEIIVEAGGRIYLAKDALMTKKIFRQCYSNWEKFEEIRAKYGAIGKFQSHQSLRLGLG